MEPLAATRPTPPSMISKEVSVDCQLKVVCSPGAMALGEALIVTVGANISGSEGTSLLVVGRSAVGVGAWGRLPQAPTNSSSEKQKRKLGIIAGKRLMIASL